MMHNAPTVHTQASGAVHGIDRSTPFRSISAAKHTGTTAVGSKMWSAGWSTSCDGGLALQPAAGALSGKGSGSCRPSLYPLHHYHLDHTQIQCGDKESERVLKFEHAPHRGKTRPYSVKQTLATTPAPLSPSSVSTATGTEDDMLAEIGVMASAVMSETRPPLIKTRSQGLLRTHRPDISNSHRSSSSGSTHILTSLNNNNESRASSRSYGESSTSKSIPALKKMPKSILKTTRPVMQTRHQVHSHLGSSLEYQRLGQQQQQQRPQSQWQMPRVYHCQESQAAHEGYHRQQQPQRQQQDRILKQRNHGSSQPSQKHSHLRFDNPTSSSALSKMSSRPLPTPPAAKYVRWATHNEVLEIQNIDELIMLGYYDDYDSDLGWDYRDESLDDEVDGSLGNDASDEDEDEDDDLHHYLNDNERSSSEEQVQKTVESKGEQSRQPVNYYDLVCHHQRQTQQLQFQYQPQSLQNLRQIQQQHPPQAHSGGQVEIESELSVMDAKSEMAEDELIRRFIVDSIFSSGVTLSSHQGIIHCLDDSTSNHPTKLTRRNSDANSTNSSCSASTRGRTRSDNNNGSGDGRSSDRPLPPIPSSPLQPKQHSQSSPVLSATGLSIPARLQSPPPPRCSLGLSDRESRRQTSSKIVTLLSLKASASISALLGTPSSTTSIPIPGRVRPPPLDPSQILTEVAERKRNGSGVFSRRHPRQRGADFCDMSGAQMFGVGLSRVNMASSMSTSSSSATLTPSMKSSLFSSVSPSQEMDAGTWKHKSPPVQTVANASPLLAF